VRVKAASNVDEIDLSKQLQCSSKLDQLISFGDSKQGNGNSNNT
jgi:hypothetical protein